MSAFYAMKNIRTPVLAASLNLLVCLPLAWWLSSGPMGYTGIALAASVAAIVQVLLLLTLMRSRVRYFDFGALLRSLAGCGFCSAHKWKPCSNDQGVSPAFFAMTAARTDPKSVVGTPISMV